MDRCVTSRRILVIDDSQDVADMLVAWFSQHGHRVSAVNSGAAGLAAIDELAPEVVFLDLSMPGMSGFDVAAALRQRGARRFKLIAFTSFNDPAVKAAAEGAGFELYLMKTAELDQLLSALDVLPGAADGRAAPGE